MLIRVAHFSDKTLKLLRAEGSNGAIVVAGISGDESTTFTKDPENKPKKRRSSVLTKVSVLEDLP